MKVFVNRMNKEIPLPVYKREGDAGMDICSAEDFVLKTGEKRGVSTALRFAIPEGYVGLVWDRSGMAYNYSIKTMGGVLDSNYRGELKVILINLGKEDFIIEKGMRIAQLLIKKVEKADLEEVEELDETIRGANGLGSTGLK